MTLKRQKRPMMRRMNSPPARDDRFNKDYLEEVVNG